MLAEVLSRRVLCGHSPLAEGDYREGKEAVECSHVTLEPDEPGMEVFGLRGLVVE